MGCALSAASPADADDASGTWTGVVEGRCNAYFERSTRVVVPELKVGAASPSGLRLGAAYLVDVISTASVVQADADAEPVFTELRHGGELEAGKELDLGATALDLQLRGAYSAEDDYTSVLLALEAALALEHRTTSLSLSISHNRDHVQSNLDPDFDDTLRGASGRLGYERVISRSVIFSASYQLARLEGFLGNPYRRVLVGPLPYAEDHPRTRVRHNATAGLRVFVAATETALHVSYRAYLDSWGIAALTPEARIYQSLGPDLLLALRYRYYTQTAAEFFRHSYPVGWSGHISNDPKMAAMTTHGFGLTAELRLRALLGAAFELAQESFLDLSALRVLSSSAYGNGVIVTAGVRLAY